MANGHRRRSAPGDEAEQALLLVGEAGKLVVLRTHVDQAIAPWLVLAVTARVLDRLRRRGGKLGMSRRSEAAAYAARLAERRSHEGDAS